MANAAANPFLRRVCWAAGIVLVVLSLALASPAIIVGGLANWLIELGGGDGEG